MQGTAANATSTGRVRSKLSNLGVTKSQSSRWQRLAAMPKDEREAKIEKAKRERAEMRADDEARVRALTPVAGKLLVIPIRDAAAVERGCGLPKGLVIAPATRALLVYQRNMRAICLIYLVICWKQ
jgi:hypothetical protein